MTPRLPRTRTLCALAAAAALVLTLTACSDDDAEPTADRTTSDAPVSTEPTSEPTSEPTEPTTPTSEPTTPTSEPTSDPPTQTSSPSEPPTETVAPDPDAAPTTYAEAQARFDAVGQEPQDVTRFETASGIYCLLDSDFVIGCELPQGAAIPTSGVCGDGPSQSVGRIEIDRGGPEPVCNTDTIREGGAPKLAVDSVAASSATGLQCLAEDIGVTCVDSDDQQGFFIGTGQYTVF